MFELERNSDGGIDSGVRDAMKGQTKATAIVDRFAAYSVWRYALAV